MLTPRKAQYLSTECVNVPTYLLTVQHIIIACVEFAHRRSHFVDVKGMNDLFHSVRSILL